MEHQTQQFVRTKQRIYEILENTTNVKINAQLVKLQYLTVIHMLNLCNGKKHKIHLWNNLQITNLPCL